MFGAILGAILSVGLAVWLDLSGTLERLRERRRKQEAQRTREEDLPSKQEPPLKLAFCSLRDSVLALAKGTRDLLALTLMVPWVLVFYLLLLSGFFWLDSLMLDLGFPDKTATAAFVADWVLSVLTGAWIATSVRTRKRSIPARLVQTTMVALLFAASSLLAAITESLLSAGGCLLAGVWLYVRLFP